MGSGNHKLTFGLTLLFFSLVSLGSAQPNRIKHHVLLSRELLVGDMTAQVTICKVQIRDP